MARTTLNAGKEILLIVGGASFISTDGIYVLRGVSETIYDKAIHYTQNPPVGI